MNLRDNLFERYFQLNSFYVNYELSKSRYLHITRYG